MTIREFMWKQPDNIFILMLENDFKIVINGLANYDSVWRGSKIDDYNISRQEDIRYKGKKALALYVEKE